MSDAPTTDARQGDDKSLDRLRASIASHAGLEMPDWVLQARSRERMSALGIASPDDYAALVTSPGGGAELEHLLEALRVGETRFFRHLGHVKAVAETLVPELRERRSGKRIRAWSAGCASGEEAYTLAAILTTPVSGPGCEVRVVATDLSTRAIAIARTGRYPISALDHVPDPWRARTFASGSDRGFIRVAEPVARRVSFEQRNLLRGPYPGRFDIIWCRNVLIYFTPDGRRRAIAHLVASMEDHGALFVGYSESLRDVAELLPERIGDTVVYRKARKGASPARSATSPEPLRSRRPSRPMPVPKSASAAAAPGAISEPASGRVSSPSGDLVMSLAGSYDDSDRLAAQLDRGLEQSRQRKMERGQCRMVIDLDGAEYLGSRAAVIVRNARERAEALGIELVLTATRPGPQRWLRRHGFTSAGGDS